MAREVVVFGLLSSKAWPVDFQYFVSEQHLLGVRVYEDICQTRISRSLTDLITTLFVEQPWLYRVYQRATRRSLA